MRAFWIKALQAIVRALVGALNYERIQLAVIHLSDTEMTGEQKKQIVLNEAAAIIEVAGRDLVSIAIKTAVLMMRNRK